MSKEGDGTIDIDAFEAQLEKDTMAMKFNKVVSGFMILLKENKDRALTKEQRERLTNLLNIYAPVK